MCLVEAVAHDAVQVSLPLSVAEHEVRYVISYLL